MSKHPLHDIKSSSAVQLGVFPSWDSGLRTCGCACGTKVCVLGWEESGFHIENNPKTSALYTSISGNPNYINVLHDKHFVFQV